MVLDSQSSSHLGGFLAEGQAGYHLVHLDSRERLGMANEDTHVHDTIGNLCVGVLQGVFTLGVTDVLDRRCQQLKDLEFEVGFPQVLGLAHLHSLAGLMSVVPDMVFHAGTYVPAP